eukprot:1359455-Amorphochlora_amoeboformis.AAC.1
MKEIARNLSKFSVIQLVTGSQMSWRQPDSSSNSLPQGGDFASSDLLRVYHRSLELLSWAAAGVCRKSLGESPGGLEFVSIVNWCPPGGFYAARSIDKNKYDVRVISPSNHFTFTPLVPSSAVGTLEFRCIQEPVRTINGLAEYYQAKARDINTDERMIHCRDIFKERDFRVPYDYLIIACGSKTNTFETPGVDEREGKEVQFLKNLYHARQIRYRILECFERAGMPDIDPKVILNINVLLYTIKQLFQEAMLNYKRDY